jgi:hypothetical protein
MLVVTTQILLVSGLSTVVKQLRDASHPTTASLAHFIDSQWRLSGLMLATCPDQEADSGTLYGRSRGKSFSLAALKEPTSQQRAAGWEVALSGAPAATLPSATFDQLGHWTDI